jgi:hypothetical protein
MGTTLSLTNAVDRALNIGTFKNLEDDNFPPIESAVSEYWTT